MPKGPRNEGSGGAPEERSKRASDLLLSLAKGHFNEVMCHLQSILKEVDTPPHPMLLKTLENFTSRYALRTVPYIISSFVYLQVILILDLGSREKVAICSAVEKMCLSVAYYYKNWRLCHYPREAESSFCRPLLSIYQRLSGYWQQEEDRNVSEAALKARWPMLAVLVRYRPQQDEILRKFPDVIKESRMVDAPLMAKGLYVFLEGCVDCHPPNLKKVFRTLEKSTFSKSSLKIIPLPKSFAALTSGDLEISPASFTNGRRDQELSSQGAFRGFRIPPQMGFLQHGRQTWRGNRRDDFPPFFCQAREATLFFLKELLSSPKVEGCLEWEMVTYLFRQVAVHTSQGVSQRERAPRDPSSGRDEATRGPLPSPSGGLSGPACLVRDSARGLMPREADVQDLSIEVLEHVNTSATGMFKALWPKLLSFLLPPEYTPALTPLCRCLKELAVLRPEGSVLFLGSCRGVKLPSPQEIFGRLLVLSSSGSQRGFWALQLLHALRADIHEAVGQLWAQQIPAIWGYCQAEGTRGSQPEWQQKLLQILRRSLKTMEDDRWTKNLILALEDQMGSYADGSLEKSVLYQVLGLSLACCADRTYVLHWLERLIENANYLEAAEKEKVAEILSFAALDHLDLTLATLDDCRAGMDLKMGLSALLTHHKVSQRPGPAGQCQLSNKPPWIQQDLKLEPEPPLMPAIHLHIPWDRWLQNEEVCSTDGIYLSVDIRLSSDYKTGRRGHLLKTLILAYGRVAIRAPKELLLKSGEAEILKKVLDLYRMSFQVRSRRGSEGWILVKWGTEGAGRCGEGWEWKRGSSLYSRNQPNHLKPRLPVEALREMLDGVIKSLFLLPPLERLKRIANDEQDASNIEVCQAGFLLGERCSSRASLPGLSFQLMYTRSVEAMGKLFDVLVTEEPTTERIDIMFQLIEPWFLECEWSRERALQASFQVLAPFQASFRLPDGENFKGYGFAVSFLAPYILENSIACRQWAAKCISCLIHIQGGSRITEAEEKEVTSALCDLQAEVPTDLSGAWARLAKVVSIHLAKDQLLDFTEAILEDLMSGIPSYARAAGYWLLANLQNHGEAMKSKVPELLDTFCSRLPIITQGGMEEVLLEAVCIMARSHLDTVLGHLLRRSLPLDSETGKLWRSFDRDPSLAVRVLAKLMSCVNQPSILGSTTSSSIDESGDYAEEEPLKATCAIYEVLSGVPSEVDLQKLFPELLFTLLWQVSQTLGQKIPPCEGRRRLFLREQHLTPGNPCSLSVDTLKALIVKGTPIASQEEIKTADFWGLLGDPRTHPEGLCQLTKWLLENGLLKDQVIQDVLPWMDASSEKLRLAGTALFTEVIQEPSFTRWAALRAFVPTLIRNVEDQHAGIRRMALRSLGRLFLVAPDQVKGLKKDLLILLFNHLRDSAVVDEALEALALVLPCLRMGKVAFLFRELCWRASKYLSEEDDAIRAAAFHLFGALATRAKQGYKTFFANLVKENLALLLIYQGDPNPNISEACKMAFLQCLPFVTKRHLQQLHQTTKSGNINALCQQLVKAGPHLSMGLQRDLVPYFQSRQEELQRRAVEISGALLQSTPVTALEERTLQLLLTELAPLQGDASTTLQSAAEALEDHVHQKRAELQDDATRGSSTTQNSTTWPSIESKGFTP
ncbi:maestro heat-like repeat-containing protein family member 2B [Pogona vitticeps]